MTAKGGDRTKGFVQWRMLRIFLAYLALNVAGILWAFVLDDTRSLADASIIAYIWTWYNIVILVMACFVCVEASQARRGDRFHIERRRHASRSATRSGRSPSSISRSAACV